MAIEDDKRDHAAAEDDDPERTAAQGSSGLPRPVQEHLGQQLRTTYQTMAEKPAFLGDTSVPAELDQHLQRLETRERIRRKGLEAVQTALGEGEGPEPGADRREGRR